MSSFTQGMRSWGVRLALVALVGSLAAPAAALAGDVSFTADTDIDVPTSGIGLVILSGSAADSVVLDTNTVTVTVSGLDTLTLRAPGRNKLTNDKGISQCLESGGQVQITVDAADSPIVFTPSATTCSTGGGGGGGGGSSTAPDTTPTIDLTAPSGTVTAGSAVSVTWTVGGSGIQGVRLAYSINGGLNFTTIADNAPKTGPYAWTVPATLSGSVILRATGRDGSGSTFATDQTTLTVAAPGAVPEEVVPSPEMGTLPALSTLTDEQAGITRDSAGRRVAPLSGTTGASPVTGAVEPVSTVRPGQLIRGNSYPTIYLVTDDLKRHPFWDATSYFTWTDSWDRAVWVTDATLSTLPMSYPMLPKPGVVLVKIASDPKVYAVGPGDGTTYQLRWVPTEAVAIALYGSAWSDYVIDLEPTTLARYGSGTDMTSSDAVSRSIMKTRAQLAALVAGTAPPAPVAPSPSAPAAAPTSACTLGVRVDRFLAVGSSGPDVLAMQKLLKCLGSFPTGVEPNGYFGPSTDAAVKDFQSDKGLDVRGYVGPGTRDALNAYLAP